MEPIEYFLIIRRRWPVIVAGMLLGLVAGYVTAPASSVNPTTATHISGRQFSYRTSAILGISSSQADPSGLDLDAMVFLANSGPVLDATAKSLKVPVSDIQRQGQVSATAKETLSLLQVTATQLTAGGAVKLANAFGAQLIDFIDAQMLTTYQANLKSDNSQLTALKKLIGQLQRATPSTINTQELNLAQTQLATQELSYRQLQFAGPGQTGLHVIDSARAGSITLISAGSSAQQVVPSDSKRRIALGGLAGLLVGLGVALVWERFDTSIRTRQQAETIFGLPVLGEVPRVSRSHRRRGLVVVDDPVSAPAEAYRMVQTALSVSSSGGLGGLPEAVLLCSPGRLEGKELVVANIAASFSEVGNSVIIVAADAFDLSLPALMRRSAAIPLWHEEAERLRASGDDRGDVATALATVIDGVSLLMNGHRPVLGDGPSRPHTNLVSAGRRLANVVLIDTPPVLLNHEAGRLSPVVDSVVLMCEIGEVSAADARLAVDRLRRLGAPLKGVVLVGRGRPMAKLRASLRAREGQHARGGVSPNVAQGTEHGEAERENSDVRASSDFTGV